ncbi:AbrB family transcriptional regulator [Candidatus Desulfarcum epimagneticum]|uniref:AbrB family transcriptional regulator n=1 Tax=uncultured Desulfobacteraceae bacterium TaxID=218296 RepID=A0A484HGG9_9BACT|nr:AbrB family transcriptional regulator [uncultured Desulfobacteraceae bacterium]
MTLATLTTKGQVTIPKAIRDSLKLSSGDKIEIIVTKNREAIIRPAVKKVDDVFRRLHARGKKAVSIEAMNEGVRDRMRNKFK